MGCLCFFKWHRGVPCELSLPNCLSIHGKTNALDLKGSHPNSFSRYGGGSRHSPRRHEWQNQSAHNAHGQRVPFYSILWGSTEDRLQTVLWERSWCSLHWDRLPEWNSSNRGLSLLTSRFYDLINVLSLTPWTWTHGDMEFHSGRRCGMVREPIEVMTGRKQRERGGL